MSRHHGDYLAAHSDLCVRVCRRRSKVKRDILDWFYGTIYGCDDIGDGLINPRRACAARVTVVSVCLSTTILALQATRRLMSDTNSFSATRA